MCFVLSFETLDSIEELCTHKRVTDETLISILPKNHADGDKWPVTEIDSFTSI